MKKLLLTLAAVVGMLGAGSGNAWADTVLLHSGNGTVTGTSPNYTWTGNTGSEAEGFTISNSSDKNMSAASGAKMKIDGTVYTGFKISTKTYTLTFPDNIEVSSLTFYGVINGDDAGTTYFKTVGDFTDSEKVATMTVLRTGNSKTSVEPSSSTFTSVQFNSSGNYSKSLDFTTSGKEIGCVIQVTYTNVAATTAGKPIATSPIFSFAEKGYTVSLTAKNDGETVKYTLNSGAETEYSGSIKVENGDKLIYWAESEGLDKSEEGTLEVSGLASYDESKAYVAWAYQNAYTNVLTYTTDSDPLYKAMSEVYNIVPIAGATSDAPASLCPTLESADLLVISEAMKSNQTFSNGLTDYVGKLPVLNMKAFSYGKSSWSTWGSGSNPSPAAASISPTDGNYEMFKNLTVENGEILLFDGTLADGSKANRVQAVALKDGLTNPVTLAQTGSSVAIHTADFDKGYIFIGISVDDITNANANAQQLIKNAAALLLAGNVTASAEATELGTASFANMAYATFVSESAAIIPEGVTAYVGALNDDNTYLNLTEVSGYIPANTPVVLEGTQGTPATLKSTIYNIAEVEGNDLKGSTTDIAVPSGKDVYTLSVADEKVAFRKYTGSTLNAGKAYLELPAGSAAPMIRFTGIDTDEPGNVTGINAVTIENNAQQVIYDLRGRRVLSLDRPGLYIVNGKKVAVQ